MFARSAGGPALPLRRRVRHLERAPMGATHAGLTRRVEGRIGRLEDIGRVGARLSKAGAYLIF